MLHAPSRFANTPPLIPPLRGGKMQNAAAVPHRPQPDTSKQLQKFTARARFTCGSSSIRSRISLLTG
jgi:hypothetical protein